MKLRHKILFTVIALTIVIILVNILGPDYESLRRDAYESLRYEVFSGVVLKKFRDKNNHDYPTIELRNAYGTQLIRLQLDESGLYNFVQEKDSIVKDYGSYVVKVYRQDKLFQFTLNYDLK